MTRESLDGRAQEIRRAMYQLRQELDEDVHQVKESAATLTNWKHYFKNYPWASMGVAAVVGYLVVPRRLEIQSPDAATIAKLAKKNRLVVEHQPKNQAKTGVFQTAFAFLSSLAIKAVTTQIAHHLANSLGTEGGEQSSAFNTSPQNSFGAGQKSASLSQNGRGNER